MFTYGVTEPTRANTGVGVVSAPPQLVYAGSLRPTRSTTISNRIIKQPVPTQLPGVTLTLVNCDLQLSPSGLSRDTRAISNNAADGKVVARFCSVHAMGPSLWVNGGGTRNVTLDRCRVWNVVDGFDSLGGLVAKGCFIEKLLRLYDAADASKVTHNDGFQLVGGHAHRIFGCAIHAFNSEWSNRTSKNNVATTAIMLSPNYGPITGLDVTHNWVYGGDYQVNGMHLDRAKGNQGRLSFNRFFGPVGSQLGITASRAGSELLSMEGNVDASGRPLAVRWV